MGILTIPHITRLPTDARSPARLPQKAAKTGQRDVVSRRAHH
jgi:hypothetical protein